MSLLHRIHAIKNPDQCLLKGIEHQGIVLIAIAALADVGLEQAAHAGDLVITRSGGSIRRRCGKAHRNRRGGGVGHALEVFRRHGRCGGRVSVKLGCEMLHDLMQLGFDAIKASELALGLFEMAGDFLDVRFNEA